MRSKRFLSVCLGGIVLVAAAVAAADWWSALPQGLTPKYVGRQSCIECHASQGQAFAGSNHDRAMDLATPETVLGNFDDQEFTHQGVTTRMFREGDKFFITTEGPTGKTETFPVKYTFGVKPLQQYMVEFPDGRVQVQTIAWDTEARRWFYCGLYPDERILPGDWLHWTGGGQNWNYMCAECHSTDVHKNYDLKTNTYHTTFGEIDVSCEACHGPGSIHVELAHAKSLFWDRHYGYGLARLKSKDTNVEIETCAKCHARRRLVHSGDQAGKPLLDYYAPELLDGNVYQADGQLLDEAYEYGSFLQSKMYHKGVRCTDCHNPHTAQLRAEGNQLCARCHTPGKFDTPSHHHHKPEGKGASCVACHMPEKLYMVVDPRRDHSLRVPRPDLTVKFGTSNACADCHKDKTPQWARDAILSWTGGKTPGEGHFGKQLATARAGGEAAGEALLSLVRNDQTPSIVRASAMSLLGQFPDERAMRAAEKAIADRDPLVRAVAVRNLEQLPHQRMISLVTPLLSDPVRLVRTEAARVLTLVPTSLLIGPQREVFDAALDEYLAGQFANDDQPAAHLNLGVVYSNLQQPERAEEEYQTALRLDRTFIPARFNLAMLYYGQQKLADAERLYREVIELQPQMADAYYSLGLLLAEDEKRLSEATEHLAQAAKLSPGNARCRYNLGLAYQTLGRPSEAEKELLAAYELTPPGNPQFNQFVQALVYFYNQQKRPDRAEEFARQLQRE